MHQICVSNRQYMCPKGTYHVSASALVLRYRFFKSPNETIAVASAGANPVLHSTVVIILLASIGLRHTLCDTEPRCLNLVTAASTKMAS